MILFYLIVRVYWLVFIDIFIFLFDDGMGDGSVVFLLFLFIIKLFAKRVYIFVPSWRSYFTSR